MSTRSLHDALPISAVRGCDDAGVQVGLLVGERRAHRYWGTTPGLVMAWKSVRMLGATSAPVESFTRLAWVSRLISQAGMFATAFASLMPIPLLRRAARGRAA